MKRSVCLCVAAVLASVVLTLPAGASPVTLSFYGITGNNAVNTTTGESQLFVEAIDYAPGKVQFHFWNTGPLDSVISEIYFDNGTLLGISNVINGTGVSFDVGKVSPPDLPGGNSITPAFETSASDHYYFAAEADNPAPHKGVGPGKEVSIILDLLSDGTYNDVLEDLSDGRIRIGIHVTGMGMANDGSESFVNNPIPEPATLAILGLGGLLLRRRIA